MKWLGPVVVVVLAVLAEVTLGRAGGGPDFALFFGRFHPLVVHLPIGFFLLVAMAEAATFVPKLRDRVEPAIGLLVPVSALAALLAFLMGQLLALEGGFPAGVLGWHRRLTLLAIMGMAACWILFERQRDSAGNGRLAYRGAMAATLGLLSLGAHFGGTMTRGESYLSKYAPGPLKPLLGSADTKKPTAEPTTTKPAAAGAEPLVYQDVLQPILKEHCMECHGPEKQKGKLRIDSLELLIQGGENGPAVVAGAPKKSPLLARMLLPASDDDHMPPEGKPTPPADQLALIEFWIERGASPTLKVRDVLAPAISRSLLEHTLADVPAAANKSVPVAVGASAPSDSAASAAPAATADPSATTHGVAPATGSGASSAASGATTTTANVTSGTTAAAATEPASVAPALPAAGGGATSGPAVLATYCEKCHGSAKQKGKLRVDSVAALLKGGSEGPALVPGSPDKSSILQRVRLTLGSDEHMPPKKEPQPSASEVAALVAWVRSGAGGGGSSAAVAAAGKPSAGTPVAANAGSASSAPGVGSLPDAATGSGAGESSGVPAATAPSTNGSASGEPATAVASVAADVSGPPDTALLQSMPEHVALFGDGVQPLLREKCGKCHIKDKPAGGLNVDQHAQLIEGGFSGAGVVPKDRKASALMQRLVLPPSNDEHMPPEGEPVLSADEVELVGAWIDQGAPAQGATETAKLTAGAVRALSARGVKGTGPQPLPPQAGGCGACSVPGAPQSKWLGLQAVALLGAAMTWAARRSRR